MSLCFASIMPCAMRVMYVGHLVVFGTNVASSSKSSSRRSRCACRASLRFRSSRRSLSKYVPGSDAIRSRDSWFARACATIVGLNECFDRSSRSARSIKSRRAVSRRSASPVDISATLRAGRARVGRAVNAGRNVHSSSNSSSALVFSSSRRSRRRCATSRRAIKSAPSPCPARRFSSAASTGWKVGTSSFCMASMRRARLAPHAACRTKNSPKSAAVRAAQAAACSDDRTPDAARSSPGGFLRALALAVRRSKTSRAP
mmetsp:Transcript_2242/g.8186  ORF Transcript_2242/g.8186 Transcript_2242/m.8186 type:complete len:259 (-) Transcript_2242:1414-2190(-)